MESVFGVLLKSPEKNIAEQGVVHMYMSISVHFALSLTTKQIYRSIKSEL